MKTRATLAAAITITSSLGLLSAAPVYAGKDLYPGTMCVQWNSSQPVPQLSHSRIFNDSSTKELGVDCPIIHTNFNSSSGNNLDDADIGVINQSSNPYLRCWLNNRYQSGATVYGGSGGTRTAPLVSNGEQNLDFNGTSRNAENWYYIGCSIPRKVNGQKSGITYYSASQ